MIDIKKLEEDKAGFEKLLAEQYQLLEDTKVIILKVEGILGYIMELMDNPKSPPEKSKEV